MRRIRKNGLPGSLDLLLDTMCNTFGGIMFIALALFVITQLVGDRITEKTVGATLALEKELAELTWQSEELEKKKKSEWLGGRDISSDSIGNILEILDVRAETVSLVKSIATANDELKKLRGQVDTISTRHQEVVSDNQQLQKEWTLQKTEIVALEEKTIALRREVASLEVDLEERQKPCETLVFSMEHAMPSYAERPVYLINNRMYSEQSVSREPIKGEKDMVRVSPIGEGVACTQENFRKHFQGNGNSVAFVHIWVGENCFDSFLTLKRFLRKESYPVSWAYSKNFVFKEIENPIRNVSQ